MDQKKPAAQFGPKFHLLVLAILVLWGGKSALAPELKGHHAGKNTGKVMSATKKWARLNIKRKSSSTAGIGIRLGVK